MASGALDVVVRFVGDASGLQKEAGKVDDIGKGVGKSAKMIGGAIAGAFAVATVADWVGEAENAQKQSAKLAKTLANAGDATGEWAKSAENLASSLSKEAGIDDDVIKGGQTILATFHAAVPVMDRATRAAVDLSATGFGSVESAATMLGKALEDPLKGITALGRAGVTFTQQQKEQIAAFMAAGDAASAQAIILANVESQVGGVAAASATAGDKMKVAFGEAKESIGAALLPVLQQLAPVLQSMAGFVEQNATWLVPMAAGVAAVVVAMKALEVAAGAAKVATALWTVAQWALNVAMDANPLGLVVIAIFGLVAAIVVVIKYHDWIIEHWPLLAAVLSGPIAGAAAIIITHWDAIRNALATAVEMMKTVWSGLIDFVASIPGRIVGLFSGLAAALYDVGRNAMESFGRGIMSVATGILDKVKDIGGTIADALNPFGSPETKAFYTGQAVMADFQRGILSRQAAVGRTLAAVGASSASSLGGRGGAARITVNVTAPVGSNPAEIGRTVADYLDAFYRRNGNRTRAVA